MRTALTAMTKHRARTEPVGGVPEAQTAGAVMPTCNRGKRDWQLYWRHRRAHPRACVLFVIFKAVLEQSRSLAQGKLR